MKASLIEADDSVLIAIDIQNYFLKKLPTELCTSIVKHACWLLKVAHWRNVPLIVTAEELDKHPVADEILRSLPAETHIFDKRIFGLANQPDILEEVKQTKRSTTVLIGLETDVCVAQSAIGLLENGYRVVVVADATGSPEIGHKIGLNRMHDAGALIVSVKSLFYEWLRDLNWNERFQKECPELDNADGILL
ncbi:MAG TPA: isochorismatase family protein [Acidobacteriota bacterium]|nr:isochorismatase family protein [Acidobacteriota bacterium]